MKRKSLSIKIEEEIQMELDNYHLTQGKIYILAFVNKNMSTTFKQDMKVYCDFTSDRNDFTLISLDGKHKQEFGFAYRSMITELNSMKINLN